MGGGQHQAQVGEREHRFALTLARQAGEVLRGHFGRIDRDDIELKGERNPVTEADRASEELIVAGIRRQFPQDGILAEEQTRQDLEARRVWLVDPLDGTVNFTHAHPFVGISIALAVDWRIQLGVVHLPMLGETFSALRGQGTRRHRLGLGGYESVRCHVSAIEQPKQALAATGFPYVRETARFNNLDAFNRLFCEVGGLRRCGTASIDLALVACGVYDAFWEAHLECFDVAAGSLLVEEAGGRVTDYVDGADWLFGKNIVATNGTALHGFMLSKMDRAFDPDARI